MDEGSQRLDARGELEGVRLQLALGVTGMLMPAVCTCTCKLGNAPEADGANRVEMPLCYASELCTSLVVVQAGRGQVH